MQEKARSTINKFKEGIDYDNGNQRQAKTTG